MTFVTPGGGCLWQLLFIGIAANVICGQDSEQGIPPEYLNVEVDGLLARDAEITTNATCGMTKAERFCRLIQYGATNQTRINPFDPPDTYQTVQCDICDNNIPSKRHPIEYAKAEDDSRWWQSPSLSEGLKYSHVVVNIDLKQVYQVLFVMLKMGDSPRPGNWILENSIDGINYKPWIFFAETEYDCRKLYGQDVLVTEKHKPDRTLKDDEVYCTTGFSVPSKTSSGEIIISLINGRESLSQLSGGRVSEELIKFLSARYIRLNFQKIQTLYADRMTNFPEVAVYNRYYYSIRLIEVGGKCICNNHAGRCKKVVLNNIRVAKCDCQHNTCGNNCERCCPMFNQRPWRPGRMCEECNCHRKASACAYNQTVANLRMSLNKFGAKEGGGVCVDCQQNTIGINCESCKSGFYRPIGVDPKQDYPCRPCECNTIGSTGECVPDSTAEPDKVPGTCICKVGYTGAKCDICDKGFEREPITGRCVACPCDVRGSVDRTYVCKPPCNCKVNVDDLSNCVKCKVGFFNLDRTNPEGCYPCFCFGVTHKCESLNAGHVTNTTEIALIGKVQRLTGWKIISVDGKRTSIPEMTPEGFPRALISKVERDLGLPGYYYWTAPPDFLGSWLTVYRGYIDFIVKFARTQTTGEVFNSDPEVILVGADGFRMGHTPRLQDNRQHRIMRVWVQESAWTLLNAVALRPPSHAQFLTALTNIKGLLIKAKYVNDQGYIELRNVTIDRGDPNAVGKMMHVERCECPTGYTGLSCEKCIPGYRRMNRQLDGGLCLPCDCNGHSKLCDPYSGKCQKCQHNTMGDKCDQCSAGFYGDATKGTPADCKPCACPLSDFSMSKSCFTYKGKDGLTQFVCRDCKNNTAGQFCHQCAPGFYGSPQLKVACKRCPCNGNEIYCNALSGTCICGYNTVGSNCQDCKKGYFGDASKGDCKACNCNPTGSLSQECNRVTGLCMCRTNYTGPSCDTCTPGHGGIAQNCPPCKCNPVGTKGGPTNCDPRTGQCQCLPGVGGPDCGKCAQGFYKFSLTGCSKCDCSPHALNTSCHLTTGQCYCGENVIGRTCDSCKALHYWKDNKTCAMCNCGSGAMSPVCNLNTGQCQCAANVIGEKCDKCQTGYYGLGPFGCRQCSICPPGKVCDPKDGQCVCPPNTMGAFCGQCVPNAWGYHPINGCTLCNCSQTGMVGTGECEPTTGQCKCREQFTGLHCDTCQPGYFNFPTCSKCLCNKAGVIPLTYNETSGLFICNPTNGQCACKVNVIGPRCDMCKSDTFGLKESYRAGCFACYCYGLSSKCSQLTGYRMDMKKPVSYKIMNAKVPAISDTIPAPHAEPILYPLYIFRPLYFEIPKVKGDLSLAYGSDLLIVTIDCKPIGYCDRSPASAKQGEVVLSAHGGSVVMEHMNAKLSQPGSKYINFLVAMRDADWRVKVWNNKAVNFSLLNDFGANKSREMLMFALFNVTMLKVRLYAGLKSPEEIVLSYTLFMPANMTAGNLQNEIKTVEKCECPTISSGFHCQLPGEGYRRNDTNWPEVPSNKTEPPKNKTGPPFVPCQCNGRSEVCDPDTGACTKCREDTEGPQCERCVSGFYGNPIAGRKCKPCGCPGVTINNYSSGCQNLLTDYICSCKPGYMGKYCDKCAPGFYGNPLLTGCKACNCSVQGSLNGSCDASGKCHCAPGIAGAKCDQCDVDFAVVNKTCQDCRTGCTKGLFTVVDMMNQTLRDLNVTDASVGPLRWLQRLKQQYEEAKLKLEGSRLQAEKKAADEIKEMEANLTRFGNMILQQKLLKRQLDTDRCKIVKDTSLAKLNLLALDQNIREWINRMLNFTFDTTGPKSPEEMFKEAKLIVAQLEALPPNRLKRETTGQLAKDISAFLDKVRALRLQSMTTDIDATIADLTKRVKEIDAESKKINGSLPKEKANIAALDREIAEAKKRQQMVEEHIPVITDLEKVVRENYTTALDLFNKFKASESTLLPGTLKLLLNQLIKNPVRNIDSRPDPLSTFAVNNFEAASREKIKLLEANLPAINRALEARDAYKSIVVSIEAASNASMNAQAKLGSIKEKINLDGWNRSVTATKEKSVELQKQSKEFEVQVTDIRKKLTDTSQRVDGLGATNTKDEDRLKKIRNRLNLMNALQLPVAQDNLDHTKKIINNNAGNLTALDADLDKKSAAYDQMKKTADDMMDKLKDFPQFQKELDNATAQQAKLNATMFQLNSTLDRVTKRFQEVRAKLNRLKELIEVSHGAAARNPAPVRFNDNCVRSYITYYLQASNIFSFSFWFTPEYGNRELMIYGQNTNNSAKFAVTIEGRTGVAFSWSTGRVVRKISVGTTNMTEKFNYRVTVNVVPGSAFLRLERFYDSNEVSPEVREKTDVDIPKELEDGLLLDKETLLFIGGPPPGKETGPFADHLRDYLPFGGCIFGVRIQHQHVGLDDFKSVSAQCDYKKSSQIPYDNFANKKCILHSKYITHSSYSQNVIYDRPVLKPNENVETNDPLDAKYTRFDFYGAGYMRMNWSLDPAACAYLARQNLDLYLWPTLGQNSQNGELIFVYYNQVTKLLFAIEKRNQRFYYVYQDAIKTIPSTPVIDQPLVINQLFWNFPRNMLITLDPRGIVENLFTIPCDKDDIVYFGGIPDTQVELRKRLDSLNMLGGFYVGRLGISFGSPYDPLTDFSKIQMVGITRYAGLVWSNDRNDRPWVQRMLQIMPNQAGPILLKPALANPVFADPIGKALTFTFEYAPPVPAATKELHVMIMESPSTSLMVRLKIDQLELVVVSSSAKRRRKRQLSAVTIKAPLEPERKAYTVSIRFGKSIAADKMTVYFVVNDVVMEGDAPIDKLKGTVSSIKLGPGIKVTKELCIYDFVIGGKQVDFLADLADYPKPMPPGIFYRPCDLALMPNSTAVNTSAINSLIYGGGPALPVSSPQTANLKTKRDIDQTCGSSNVKLPKSAGLAQNSALEFGDLSMLKQPGKFNISLAFRVISESDMLLFVAQMSPTTQVTKEIVALALSRGAPRFYIQSPTTSGSMDIPLLLNDGQWHTVEVAMDTQTTKVMVDGRPVKIGFVLTQMGLHQVVFGGYGKSDLSGHPPGITKSLDGCMQSIYVNNVLMDPQSVGATQCSACFAMRKNLIYVTPAYATNLMKTPGFKPVKIAWMKGTDTGFKLQFTYRLSSAPNVVMFAVTWKLPTATEFKLLSVYITGTKVHLRLNTFTDRGLTTPADPSNPVDLVSDLTDQEWNVIVVSIMDKKVSAGTFKLMELKVVGKAPVTVLEFGSNGISSMSLIDVYLGGLPSVSSSLFQNITGIATLTPFTGCLQELKMDLMESNGLMPNVKFDPPTSPYIAYDKCFD